MESQIAASGYILTFFNDVESLTNSYGSYANVLIEYQALYPNDKDLKKLDDTSRERLLEIIRQLRFWINRTYIKFSSLKFKIVEFEKNEKALDTAYLKICEAPAPAISDVKDYALELNKLFVLGIVSELLTKATEIYSKLAGQNETG